MTGDTHQPAADRETAAMDTLAEFVAQRIPDHRSQWAWQNFKPTLLALKEATGAKRLLELGGGRTPLFSEDEVREMGVDYTVNDILERELSLAPAWTNKACFDVSADRVDHDGTYDLVFSQMLFEHVPNGENAYRNVHRLLSDGGAFLNFHPVLYAPPFVINAILPEALARRLLKFFWPFRDDTGIPKFPAHYSHCVIGERSAAMLRRCGFSEATMVPFFGHTYFINIPVVRELDRALERFAHRRNIQKLASYSFTIGRK